MQDDRQIETPQFKLADDKIDELTPEYMEELVNQNPEQHALVNTFDFNIFKFSSKVGRKNVMPFIASSLIRHNNLHSNIDSSKFAKFMTQIYNQYRRSVQYHNDLHGSDVAQHIHFILNGQNMAKYAQFDDLDTLSILVAALCHDVGHDGFNNRYHVVTKSHLY